jgi:hypothetical protein
MLKAYLQLDLTTRPRISSPPATPRNRTLPTNADFDGRVDDLGCAERWPPREEGFPCGHGLRVLRRARSQGSPGSRSRPGKIIQC